MPINDSPDTVLKISESHRHAVVPVQINSILYLKTNYKHYKALYTSSDQMHTWKTALNQPMWKTTSVEWGTGHKFYRFISPPIPYCFLSILRKESSLCHMLMLPLIPQIMCPGLMQPKTGLKPGCKINIPPKAWCLKTQHRNWYQRDEITELL